MERVKAGQITPPIAFNADERDAAVLLHCPQREIPEALSAVAMQALARNSTKRYPDVPALQRDIAAYTAGYAPLAERADTLRQIRLTLRRNATLTAAAAVVILVTLGFGIHAHLNSQAQEHILTRAAAADARVAVLEAIYLTVTFAFNRRGAPIREANTNAR